MPDPSAPGWVIAATPVTVTAGGSGSIPYPVSAAAQLGYVEVINSSPLTIVLSQGQVLGQIPAFTAQVLPLNTLGAPLFWSALVPAGVIVPGQDSTLYVTWTDSPPYGQWPSATGSAAVSFSGTSLGGARLLAAAGVSPNAGPFFTLGYQGLVLTTRFHNPPTNLGGAGSAYRVVVEWAQDQAFANITARRSFVVAAGVSQGGLNSPDYGQAMMATPNYGDWVRWRVIGGGFIATGGVDWLAELRTNAVSGWGLPTSAPTIAAETASALPTMGGLFARNAGVAVVVGAGLSVTITSVYPYEGPAQLVVGWGFAAAAFNDWRVVLAGLDEAGNTWRLLDHQAAVGESGVNEAVIVPPTALQLQLTNGTGASHSCQPALVPDLSRTGA